MPRLYIGLYNQFVNSIPIRTFRINSILSIRLIWNAKQFDSIRASSEDLKGLLAPLRMFYEDWKTTHFFFAPMLLTQTNIRPSATSYPPSMKFLSVMSPGNGWPSLYPSGFLHCTPSSLFSWIMRWQLRSLSGKILVKRGALDGARAPVSP